MEGCRPGGRMQEAIGARSLPVLGNGWFCRPRERCFVVWEERAQAHDRRLSLLAQRQ